MDFNDDYMKIIEEAAESFNEALQRFAEAVSKIDMEIKPMIFVVPRGNHKSIAMLKEAKSCIDFQTMLLNSGVVGGTDCENLRQLVKDELFGKFYSEQMESELIKAQHDSFFPKGKKVKNKKTILIILH